MFFYRLQDARCWTWASVSTPPLPHIFSAVLPLSCFPPPPPLSLGVGLAVLLIRQWMWVREWAFVLVTQTAGSWPRPSCVHPPTHTHRLVFTRLCLQTKSDQTHTDMGGWAEAHRKNLLKWKQVATKTLDLKREAFNDLMVSCVWRVTERFLEKKSNLIS